MPKPAQRIPRWLTVDLTILAIGVVIIIIISSLWLGVSIQHMAAPTR